MVLDLNSQALCNVFLIASKTMEIKEDVSPSTCSMSSKSSCRTLTRYQMKTNSASSKNPSCGVRAGLWKAKHQKHILQESLQIFAKQDLTLVEIVLGLAPKHEVFVAAPMPQLIWAFAGVLHRVLQLPLLQLCYSGSSDPRISKSRSQESQEGRLIWQIQSTHGATMCHHGTKLPLQRER